MFLFLSFFWSEEFGPSSSENCFNAKWSYYECFLNFILFYNWLCLIKLACKVKGQRWEKQGVQVCFSGITVQTGISRKVVLTRFLGRHSRVGERRGE